MSSKNDVVIKELMDKVEKQTAELGKAPRATWVTNGVFKFNSNDYININVCTEFQKLASALGFLIIHNEGFEKACKILNVKAVFRWDGYTVAEWEEDFKTRISIVEYNEKKRLLDATKHKLSTMVSEEAKTEMELESIRKILG